MNKLHLSSNLLSLGIKHPNIRIRNFTIGGQNIISTVFLTNSLGIIYIAMVYSSSLLFDKFMESQELNQINSKPIHNLIRFI